MTAEEKGLPANSAFSGGQVDVVNLQNGNLHISIPIETSAQRGGTVLKWAFVFDTQAWTVQWVPYSCSTPCTPAGYYVAGESTNVTSGWRFSSPFNWAVTYLSSGAINCATTSQTYQQYTNWAIIDPQGTQHALPLRQETGTSSCFGQTLAGPALDGSGLYYDANAHILYTKDGYQFSGSQTALNAGQDRNGNQVSAAADTLERDLVSVYNGTTGAGLPYTTYTIKNSADAPLTFRVDYAAVTVTSDICTAAKAQDSAISCSDSTYQYDLPSVLTLPTGKTYQFQYANGTPGDLSSLTLPTGAVITYTYQDFYQVKVNALQPSHPNFVGSRAVKNRTVDIAGTNYLWQYNPGLTTDKVIDPLNNYEIHTFSFIDALNGSQQVQSPNVYEQSVAYYNSKGTLLKTRTDAWQADYDPVNNSTANARITDTTTSLSSTTSGGSPSVQLMHTDYETFTYPCVTTGGACTGKGSRLNPTDTLEYDFGSGAAGPLLRKTVYTYLHTSNQPYINLNIVDKPANVTIYDGAGNMNAQTVNEYDVYSHTGQAMQPSNAIQHNANYATGFTTRGNLTAVSKWLNTSGTLLTTTMQYDDAGNVLSTIDPKLNKTSYSFADSWTSTACNPTATQAVPNPVTAAFQTKVTNAKGQFLSKTYYACTGLVSTVKDQNSEPTTTTYDTFDRPHQVSYPDTGRKTLCYSDDSNGSCYNSSALLSTETDTMNASTSVVRTTLYDALGRPMETQHSDPVHTVLIDTQYDGDGRAYKVSNPYRSGDTEYWTTQLYDGIGRSAGVTDQDNAASSISYSGNMVQATDEAGNKRYSQTDGLGRPATVWEDPSGLNYETDYQYNALGGLLKVTQKGGGATSSSWRVRTFSYDLLGELLCAANPEITAQGAAAATCVTPDTGTYTAGTTRFQYDKDGNLGSKTAPLPNQSTRFRYFNDLQHREGYPNTRKSCKTA